MCPEPSTARDVLSKRKQFLSLLTDEVLTKTEIESQVDYCRSTINYAIRDLEAVDFVERTSDGFRATATGQIAEATFRRYEECVRAICASTTGLETLPPSKTLPPVIFDGAVVVQPGPKRPDRPSCRLAELIRSASTVRGCTPLIITRAIETYCDKLSSSNFDLELVVETEVLAHLLGSYSDELGAVVASKRSRIHESSVSLPFGVMLANDGTDRVAVFTLSGTDGVKRLIVNDNSGSITFAKDYFRYHRARATTLSAGEPA